MLNCDKGTKEPQENKLLEKHKKRSCQQHKLFTCYPLKRKTKKANKNPFWRKKENRNAKKVSLRVSEMSKHSLICILTFPLRRFIPKFSPAQDPHETKAQCVIA